MNEIEGSSGKQKHLFSPRMVFDAIDEIRGRDVGYYGDGPGYQYPNGDEWAKTFIPELGLPKYEEVYGPKKSGYNVLRILNFIKTEQERAIGIGKDYPFEPLGLGECYLKHGYAFHQEIIIFKFRYDYINLIEQYNKIAEENGAWQKIKDPSRFS